MNKYALALVVFLFAHHLVNAHDNYHIHSASVPEAEEKTEHAYKEIHTQELNGLIHSPPSGLVIIDARSAEYDDGKRIPGAKFMPFDSDEKVILSILPNKKARIVIYCTSPECPASAMLADRLVYMGYTNVMKYPEGIDGWEKSGNKVDTVKKTTVKARIEK